MWNLLTYFRWFPEVQNIYYQGNRRKQVPSNHNAKKLESFFNCAAALMTQHLQELCLDSMDDFTDLLCVTEVRFGNSWIPRKLKGGIWSLFDHCVLLWLQLRMPIWWSRIESELSVTVPLHEQHNLLCLQRSNTEACILKKIKKIIKMAMHSERYWLLSPDMKKSRGTITLLHACVMAKLQIFHVNFLVYSTTNMCATLW